VAAFQLLLSLALIGLPTELLTGEAIVHALASRVARGEALYQPLDRAPWTVAAYTPVYYWIAGVLQVFVGPGFLPGHALSFVAGLASAVLVGRLSAKTAPS